MRWSVVQSCLLVAASACAHSSLPTQVPPSEADSGSPVDRALIATVRSAPPAAGYVDLGPVVLHRANSKEDVMSELQMLADLLHADGFVLESEGRTFDGPSRGGSSWFWGGVSGGGEVAVIVAAIGLAVAAAQGGLSAVVADQHYYFRAYRLAKEPPPPVELGASAPIPEILRLPSPRLAA
jgi:hypothetical protein